MGLDYALDSAILSTPRRRRCNKMSEFKLMLAAVQKGPAEVIGADEQYQEAFRHGFSVAKDEVFAELMKCAWFRAGLRAAEKENA